jgi:murein DD-endopeptidase MepM/ murein hydrolase activator NlpD
MRNWLIPFILVLVILSAGCGSTAPTLVPSLVAPSPITQPATATHTLPPTTTATPIPPPTPSRSPTPPLHSPPTLHPTPAPPAVTFSDDGAHAFPVAGDLALMTWTHYHWDGSNAVDVEAARRLPGDSDEFNTFIQLPAVAVVSGTVTIADNPYGGLALLLYGDDGYTYYYGHLSEQWVEDEQLVRAGDLIGRIGNTGRWTQYIEPHLHFSIATHEADDWRWEPDVNAAEQFLTWFDLPWQDLDIPDYPVDQVAGWPLAVPAQIVRGFAERQAENSDQGSIDIAPKSASAVADEAPIPVYATLGGEVNVNRATVMGLRVQITNRPARTTVVYSFMLETTVADGDVVQRGDLVGYIDRTVGLNYMLFVNDVQTDPTPTLDR